VFSGGVVVFASAAFSGGHVKLVEAAFVGGRVEFREIPGTQRWIGSPDELAMTGPQDRPIFRRFEEGIPDGLELRPGWAEALQDADSEPDSSPSD
jgi:hypothetical protein